MGIPCLQVSEKIEIECHFSTNYSEPPVRMISQKFDINWDPYVLLPAQSEFGILQTK